MSLNYHQALSRLLSCESSPKLGLGRIEAILKELGNPERNFKSIHAAGTNGKGSTCAFLAAMCEQVYENVGLYTSPHLLCARERIQLNRQLISESLFCEAESTIFSASQRIGEMPSFFERMTAMAFWIFAQQKVDIAILEVGLGGRLDATNVVSPIASVITRIDLDHTHILGSTLELIAFEKAGIIKANVPVVTGWQDEAALKVISSVARDLRSPLTNVTNPFSKALPLQGEHQQKNAALAIAALEASDICLSDEQIQAGLASAKWPCRFELVQTNPPVILDGAHNEAGMTALVQALAESKIHSHQPIILVLGATEGHQSSNMIAALAPLKARLQETILTKSKSPRALSPYLMMEDVSLLSKNENAQSVSDALCIAKKRAIASNALIVVTGSLYVCGEARSHFYEMAADPELPLH